MKLQGKRIAILAENLYQEMELWVPYYRFREEGAEVKVVGAGGAKTYTSKHGYPVTVDVQERNAVGLWVRPNDHVDVVGSFRDPQTQQLKSVTLLQNVVVLATGRVNANTAHVPDEDRRYTSVTLLVLPEEAEILTLAQETGTLTLLLRNPDDLDSQEKRSVVDQRQLLTGERAGELQQKRYRTIQIIRGVRGSDAAAAAARSD